MKKKLFAEKIEKYVKINGTEGYFILRICSKFVRIFKTLKNHISGKKSKMYTGESVENVLN